MTTPALEAYLHWLKDRGLVHPVIRTSTQVAADADTPAASPVQAAAVTPPRLVFVGDLPSIEAESVGRALAGEEEVLLDRMVQAMRLVKEETLAFNVFTERLPAGVMPDSATIAAARDRLAAELTQTNGDLVVALGGFATRVLLGDRTNFQEVRGQLLPSDLLQGKSVLSTFHPRDLLRTPANKRLAWSDLQTAMRHLGLRLEHDA